MCAGETCLKNFGGKFYVNLEVGRCLTSYAFFRNVATVYIINERTSLKILPIHIWYEHKTFVVGGPFSKNSKQLSVIKYFYKNHRLECASGIF